MIILDDPKITSADFLDYLRGLRDFGKMIKDAATETIEQNQIITERVTSKISRRANIRKMLLGEEAEVKASKKKVAKKIKISAIKKEENGKWSVYDSTGKKKLGGPYDSEKKANERIREVEHFKSKSSSGEVQTVPEDSFTEVEAAKLTPADSYTLNGSTNELLVWSKTGGSAKIRGYAHSLNVGMQKLAKKVGASQRAVSRSARLSTSNNSGKIKAMEVLKMLNVLASKKSSPEVKQILAGMQSDARGILKLIEMNKGG